MLAMVKTPPQPQPRRVLDGWKAIHGHIVGVVEKTMPGLVVTLRVVRIAAKRRRDPLPVFTVGRHRSYRRIVAYADAVEAWARAEWV